MWLQLKECQLLQLPLSVGGALSGTNETLAGKYKGEQLSQLESAVSCRCIHGCRVWCRLIGNCTNWNRADIKVAKAETRECVPVSPNLFVFYLSMIVHSQYICAFTGSVFFACDVSDTRLRSMSICSSVLLKVIAYLLNAELFSSIIVFVSHVLSHTILSFVLML